MKVYGYQKELEKIQKAYGKSPILLNGNHHSSKFLIAQKSVLNDICGCGTCNDCKRFMNGNEVDVLTIQTEGKTLTLEDIAPITDFTIKRPMQLKTRYIIIRDIEKANNIVQNQLLKTLEEHNDYIQFILTTNNSDFVLDTIKSRCVQIFIPRLSAEVVGEYLEDNYKDLKTKHIVSVLAKSIQEVEEFASLGEELNDIRADILKYLTSIGKNLNTVQIKVLRSNFNISSSILNSMLFDLMLLSKNLPIKNTDLENELKSLSVLKTHNIIGIIDSINEAGSLLRTNIKEDLIINNIGMMFYKSFI